MTKRTKKTYIVDNIEYGSKTLLNYHMIFSEAIKNNIISNFTLPTAITRTKYGSCKAMVDGIEFDSLMEARYYIYLQYLLKQGYIKSFQRQVKYLLQKGYVNNVDKKIQAIEYIADFTVTDINDNLTVIDVKGLKTDIFKIKEKMFGYVYPMYNFLCVQWSNKHKRWIDLDIIQKEKRDAKKNLLRRAG